MTKNKVDIGDLLRTPYERGSKDCAWVYWQIQNRIGRKQAVDASEAGMVLAFTCGAEFRELGKSVDDARILGDAIVTHSPDAPFGVWTLYDEGPPRLFVTSTPKHGVVAVKASALVKMIGEEDGAIVGAYSLRM